MGMSLSSTHIDRSFGSTKDQIMEHGYVIEFYAYWPILWVNEGSDNETWVCHWVLRALADPLGQRRIRYWNMGMSLSSTHIDWFFGSTKDQIMEHQSMCIEINDIPMFHYLILRWPIRSVNVRRTQWHTHVPLSDPLLTQRISQYA